MRANELLPKGVTVYVDMDGVLADLFNHVGEIHDVDHYNKMTQDQWEEFFKNTNAYELFRSLPAFPTANKLLQLVQDFAGGYTILSSPLSFDREGSIKGKREWLAKHIHVKPDNIIFEHDKAKYANANGVHNILIDDYGVNIRAWNAAGGVAIKYQADEDSLSDVFKALKAASKGEHTDMDESRRKRKKRKKTAAYGPGPYGGYGYDAGYSGVSSGGNAGGDGGAGAGVGEGFK
jgi:5'(3')-deoxyribonucleotidase